MYFCHLQHCLLQDSVQNQEQSKLFLCEGGLSIYFSSLVRLSASLTWTEMLITVNVGSQSTL